MRIDIKPPAKPEISIEKLYNMPETELKSLIEQGHLVKLLYVILQELKPTTAI